MRTPHGAHCAPDILSRFYQRHQKLKQLRVLSPGRRRSRVTPLHARACRHAFYSLFQRRITHACASRCANNTEPPFCACDSPLTASHYRRGNGKRFSNPCPRPQRGTLNTHLPGLTRSTRQQTGAKIPTFYRLTASGLVAPITLDAELITLTRYRVHGVQDRPRALLE